MRKLAIIHFSPVEWYPPVMNWLNYLASAGLADVQVQVFTLRPPGDEPLFTPHSSFIRINRPAALNPDKASARYLGYLAFYSATTARLLTWRPDTVLYYETLSSLPALLYKKYFSAGTRLYIHYHEYTSPKEYKEGMRLAVWMHKIEKSIYPRTNWLSQTNETRNDLFRKDNAGVRLPALQTLPNYPPFSWQQDGRERPFIAPPLRIVYVGALSLETMYVREMAEWVIGQNGRVIWDIYTGNSTTGVRNYLQSLNNEFIRLHPPVNYYRLPEVLKQYDIGVILYNGHIPNYIYNAPNKLFEYLAMGLDVWFPDIMAGCMEFLTTVTYPKVIALDFKALDKMAGKQLTDRSGLRYAPSNYTCEAALSALLNHMTES